MNREERRDTFVRGAMLLLEALGVGPEESLDIVQYAAYELKSNYEKSQPDYTTIERNPSQQTS